MRYLLIIISFYSWTSKVLSQDFKVDTFFKRDGFVSTRILLSYDKIFFIAASNCTDANISKGKWKISNGKVQLKSDPASKLLIKPEIISDYSLSDTGLTFRIIDYFKQPIPYYYITFYDKEGGTIEFEADKNGILKINKGKFCSFMTFHEIYQFDFSKEIKDYAHIIDNKATMITLKLNYPKEILRERSNVYTLPFYKEEFIKTKKLLISTNSKLTLMKL